MNHKWHVCNSENCPICESNLDYCDVCHGTEDSLTTECCGRPLIFEELRQIRLYDRDYIKGKWVSSAAQIKQDFDIEFYEPTHLKLILRKKKC